MNGISSILLIVLWGIVIPLMLGQLWDSILKDSELISIPRSLSFGYMTIAALFQLLAFPMLMLRLKFHVLKSTFLIVIVCLLLCTIFLNYKGFVKKLKDSMKSIQFEKTELIIWVAVIFLIAVQTYLLAGQMHVDTDDSRFLAEALEAVEKDTMLEYHPLTGEFLGGPIGEMRKDITSPYPIFLGLLGELFRLPPTVAAHAVLPLLLIPLCYLVYSVVGKFFFPNDRKSIGLFLFFLSLIHLFSFETIYASGYTLLTIIWQGRSVAVMIMLPILWYILLKMTAKHVSDIKWSDYSLLVTALLGCAMLSGMGVLLSLLLTAAYTFVNIIRKKSVKFGVWMLICMCPNIFFLVFGRCLQ